MISKCCNSGLVNGNEYCLLKAIGSSYNNDSLFQIKIPTFLWKILNIYLM